VIDCQDHCLPVHQWIFLAKNLIFNKKAIDPLFIPQSSLSFSLDPVSPQRYLPTDSEAVSANHDDSNGFG
jgi:hypothetical protein